MIENTPSNESWIFPGAPESIAGIPGSNRCSERKMRILIKPRLARERRRQWALRDAFRDDAAILQDTLSSFVYRDARVKKKPLL